MHPAPEAKEFKVAIMELVTRQQLKTDFVELGRGVYSGAPADTWHNVAYELACILPGQFWPSENGVSWNKGGVCGRVIGVQNLGDIKKAQDIAADFGALGLEAITGCKYYSLGAIIRRLLAWVAPPSAFPTENKRLLAEIEKKGGASGYHECYPGVYSYSEHWDVSAYYFTMLERLKSTRVRYSREGKVEFEPFKVSERKRWLELLARVESEKPIRNMITGCMLGALRWLPYYQGNGDGTARQVHIKGKGGPYRSAGMLIVRSGWEITREVCQQMPCYYSNMDCIVTPAYNRDNEWDKCGFEVKRENKGEAHILCRGWYAIGGQGTENYKNAVKAKRLQDVPKKEVHPHETPQNCLYKQWL